jgi:hypothetical protein
MNGQSKTWVLSNILNILTADRLYYKNKKGFKFVSLWYTPANRKIIHIDCRDRQLRNEGPDRRGEPQPAASSVRYGEVAAEAGEARKFGVWRLVYG